MKRNIIIAGSRTFTNYNIVKVKLDEYISKNSTDDIKIISGHAAGGDTLGERYAKENNISLKIVPAEWNLGKAAGHIRNSKMTRYAKEDGLGVLFAFWDGKSHGTKNMIDCSKERDMEVHITLIK